MLQPLSILLADDHGLFRDSMAVWLKKLEDNIVIEFASNYVEVEALLNRNFDLLLIDLGMPGMAGCVSIKKLGKRFPQTPILVVSANEQPQMIHACLNAGASGYVTKASDGNDILVAVKTVLQGKPYFPKKHNNSLTNQSVRFSDRQLQLLTLLAAGKSNREISETLFLTEGTVKQYVSHILDILRVDNRNQAGIRARQILG
jgi:DNA-binding NarL/FixJ family response regulator